MKRRKKKGFGEKLVLKSISYVMKVFLQKSRFGKHFVYLKSFILKAHSKNSSRKTSLMFQNVYYEKFVMKNISYISENLFKKNII